MFLEEFNVERESERNDRMDVDSPNPVTLPRPDELERGGRRQSLAGEQFAYEEITSPHSRCSSRTGRRGSTARTGVQRIAHYQTSELIEERGQREILRLHWQDDSLVIVAMLYIDSNVVSSSAIHP